MFLTVGLLGVGLYCLLHRGHFMDSRENQLHLLIWTAWTCLMFLPSMHDRSAIWWRSSSSSLR